MELGRGILSNRLQTYLFAKTRDQDMMNGFDLRKNISVPEVFRITRPQNGVGCPKEIGIGVIATHLPKWDGCPKEVGMEDIHDDLKKDVTRR